MFTYCPVCQRIRYFTQHLRVCKPEPFDGTFPLWEAAA